MYFDCDNNVTLLDTHVWGFKNHIFQKVTNGCSLIHPKIQCLWMFYKKNSQDSCCNGPPFSYNFGTPKSPQNFHANLKWFGYPYF